MQARLSVILLVVALCAIYSCVSAEVEGQQGSLRRLEEVNVRDEYDSTAQPEDEAAPTTSEVEEEAEQEGEDEDAPIPVMDDKEPQILLGVSEDYNIDLIDVDEKEDPALLEEGTTIATDFETEDAEALADSAKQDQEFPDGDLNEDNEGTLELDGTESDEAQVETDVAATYHEAQDHYLEEDEAIEDPTRIDLDSLFAEEDERSSEGYEEEPEEEDHPDDVAQQDLTPELLSAQENEIDPEEDTIDADGELNGEEDEQDDEANLGEVGEEEIEFDPDNEDDVPEEDVGDEMDDTPHSELEEVFLDDEKLE